MRHACLPVLTLALLAGASATAQTPGVTFSQQDLEALAQKQAAQMGTEIIQLSNQVGALQDEATRQKSTIAQLTNLLNVADNKIATDEAQIKQLSPQVVQAQQMAANAANLATQLQEKIPTNFGYRFGGKADATEFILQNCKLSSYIHYMDLDAPAADGFVEVKTGCVPTKIPPHTQQ